MTSPYKLQCCTLQPAATSSSSHFRCQDTSDPGHFGPKIFRHHPTGAEVSGQFGTSAEMSRGPPANIFATTVVQNKGLLVIIINEDHWFYSYAQEYTADDYPLYSRTATTSWSTEI